MTLPPAVWPSPPLEGKLTEGTRVGRGASLGNKICDKWRPDANGAPAQGLRRDEFVVLEDGVPQKVKYLWQELDLPLTIVLIADISCTQLRLLDQHRQTAQQFLSRVLSQNDRAGLVSVEKQQRLVTDLTDSFERLRAGAESLGKQQAEVLGEPCSGKHPTEMTAIDPPCGETALWNGVFFSARLKLRPQPGRKAMLLLTDGWDTAAGGPSAANFLGSQGDTWDAQKDMLADTLGALLATTLYFIRRRPAIAS